MQTRKELTAATRKRYEGASRPDKIRILDEFVKTTGYHRKHVLRMKSDSSVAKVELLIAARAASATRGSRRAQPRHTSAAREWGPLRRCRGGRAG